MASEFVTRRQWDSYASRIFRANMKRDGRSSGRLAIAARAQRHIIEVRDDGMFVEAGWRESMRG